jgi:NADH-quinone oxidoreductase subunit G
LDASKLEDAFVIYLGSHGDAGAHVADVILPGAAYTEKNATYVNTEGRVQETRRAVFPKGDAREDWAIIRALSDEVGRTLPYDSLDALREKLRDDHSSFAAVDYAPGGASAGAFDPAAIGEAGTIGDAPLAYAIADFWFTNPIARASQTLAQAAAATSAARGQLQAAE